MLQELGYGLTCEINIVTRVVHDFVKHQKRVSPFMDGVPSADWWVGFLQGGLHSQRESLSTYLLGE